MRSGFDGLQTELERNNGEVSLFRGEVFDFKTQVQETANHGRFPKAFVDPWFISLIPRKSSADRMRSFIENLKVAPDVSYDNLQACMKDTRTYIIGEGVDFLTREDVGEKRVFLLSGCVGSGKTAIAHSIAHTCHREYDSLGASFICQPGTIPGDTLKYLISTIARQLSVHSVDYASRLSDVIEANPNIAQATLIKQFQSLILNPASAATSQFRPTAIVIDSIDDGWSEPLHLIVKACSKLPSWIRVFITLRDNGFTLSRLKSQSHITHRDIDVNSEQNVRDIQIYIGKRLRAIALERQLQVWPNDNAVNEMSSKAAGLFMWAVVACNSIADVDVDPMEQYEELVSNGPFRDTRASRQMDQLYLNVLSRISKRCQNEPSILPRLRQCLGTILVLRRPLPILAHNELLAIDHTQHTLRDLSPILNNLGDPKQTKPIQIIHQSIREFLTQATPGVCILNIVESEHNEALALCCLNTIRKTMPTLATHTKWIEDLSDEAGVPALPDSVISEGFWYACEFLADHVHAVTREIPDLDHALAYFMQNDLYGWLAICAMKGKSQGLEQLHCYVEVCMTSCECV